MKDDRQGFHSHHYRETTKKQGPSAELMVASFTQ